MCRLSGKHHKQAFGGRFCEKRRLEEGNKAGAQAKRPQPAISFILQIAVTIR